jgi:hypothetical protein
MAANGLPLARAAVAPSKMRSCARATGVPVGVVLCAGERGDWRLDHDRAVPAPYATIGPSQRPRGACCRVSRLLRPICLLSICMASL